MRLSELLGVKKFYDSTVEEVLHSMSSDYQEVGRGSFGVTLKNSSKPTVVKFWVVDSSYDDFINYVADHPSKYLPKLYSKPKKISSFFIRPKNFPEKIHYVKMESLIRLKNEDDVDMLSYIFSDLADLHTRKDVDHFIEKLKDGKDSKYSEWSRLEKLVDDIPKFLHEMFEMLRHLLNGKNDLDIHEDNIMQRANGELVITDPIYNAKDLKSVNDIKTALYHLKKEEAVKGKTPKGST
jgi:hypothetical protein